MKKEELKAILRKGIRVDCANAYLGLGERIKVAMKNPSDAVWLGTLASAFKEVSEEWEKAIDEITGIKA